MPTCNSPGCSCKRAFREVLDPDPPPPPEAKADGKLYIAVRADLSPPGLLAAQAAHAAQEFVFAHPELAKVWHEVSNTIVLVEVADSQALCELIADAEALEIEIAPFYDDDLDPPLTAIALGPGEVAAKLCKGYPSALRKVA